MANTNKKVAQTRKAERQAIVEKLEKALAAFKAVLGEKKFNKRIKKASKIFISKKSAQPEVQKEPLAKKPMVKNPVPVKKA